MKVTSLLIVSLLFIALPVAGGAFLDFFSGKSDGDSITLEWKTRSEENLKQFKVERRAANQTDFVSIADIQAKGSNSNYTFVDKAAYKTSSSLYIYRLRIVEAINPSPSYSQEVRVSHSVSSVKRTWGSIKAMFR